jgi:IS30 family transposase
MPPLRRPPSWTSTSAIPTHLGNKPWQRGSNENTNGLLRQYFAKGADLSVFPADYLDYVATQLNTRPRKTLGWKKPAEVLDELLSNPPKPPTVASTA